MVDGPDGISRTVTLTSPTHPLRLLWLTTWAELGHHWLESTEDAARSAVAAAGETLSASPRSASPSRYRSAAGGLPSPPPT